jgi:hypothetical protein
VALVQELVEPARKAYMAAYGEAAPTLTVDSRDYLPPPPKGDDDDSVSWCVRRRDWASGTCARSRARAAAPAGAAAAALLLACMRSTAPTC